MSDTEKRDAVQMHYRGIALVCEENATLRAEVDRLRAENAAFRAEIDRLRRILAALREPIEAVTRVVRREWHLDTTPDDLVRFAVAAAEQEVGE